MNHELQHILPRTQRVSHGAIIQTILRYLGRSEETGTMAQTSKHLKKEEEKSLI